eukprot:s3223_g7.t1
MDATYASGGTAAKRQRLSSMAKYSVRSIDAMQRLLQAQETRKQPSGAAKRAFAKALQPARNCYRLLSVKAEKEGTQDIMFAAADMKSLLRYMAEESPCFLEMLKDAAMPLKFVLSHDETTAGNVVSTEARLKAMMFYGTFTAFATIIDSPHAWIPLAVLSRDQMSRVQGGMAAVHKIFIEDFAAQSLDTSFEVAPGCHIQVQFAIMIADMDGQRMALCSKGSAALKPCSFCIDCVCKDAAGAQNDLRFKTIAEPDIKRFTPQKHDQVEAFMARNIPEVSRITKKGPEDVLEAIRRASWQRPGPAKRNGENDSWLKKMFTPAFFLGSCYKGSAKQTRALAVLLRWLCESVWVKNPELTAAARSFLKLGQCAECLRRIGQLLHLPEQYRSMQTAVSCWGTEAKHKDYKSVFSTVVQHFLTEKAGGSEFSQQLLPRLLNRHCQMLNETPFSSKGFILQNAFDASAVELATGLHGCRLAGQCRVNMLDLKEKDVILWNYPDYKAGIINFFIEEHNQLFGIPLVNFPMVLIQPPLAETDRVRSFLQCLNGEKALKAPAEDLRQQKAAEQETTHESKSWNDWKAADGDDWQNWSNKDWSNWHNWREDWQGADWLYPILLLAKRESVQCGATKR